MKTLLLLVLLFIGLTAATPLMAQTNPESTQANMPVVVGQEPAAVLNADSVANMAPDATKRAATPKPMSLLEAKLSTGLLIFAVVVLLIVTALIRMQKLQGPEMVKFVLITLIIISTLYLITAGYSNDQIAPEIGLLGTIAGYLLGKSGVNDGSGNNTNNNNSNSDPVPQNTDQPAQPITSLPLQQPPVTAPQPQQTTVPQQVV